MKSIKELPQRTQRYTEVLSLLLMAVTTIFFLGVPLRPLWFNRLTRGPLRDLVVFFGIADTIGPD